jgi:hypothetical protein
MPKALTLEIARRIRELYSNGTGLSDIARVFDTTPQNVFLIVNNRTWREPPNEIDLLQKRLFNRVVKEPGDNGCWLWTGATSGTRDGSIGYGELRRLGVNHKTHHVSWIIHFGPIPADKHVLHHCDNPPCIRPDHLFLGDHGMNMRDMTDKGRGRPGGRSL